MNTTPYFELGCAFPVNEVFADVLEDRDIDLMKCAEISKVSYEDLAAFTNGELESLSSEQYILLEESLKLPKNFFGRHQMFYDKHHEKNKYPDLVLQ